MRIIVSSFFIFSCFLGCARHEQSLFRVAEEEPVKIIAKDEPEKELIKAVNAGRLDEIKKWIAQGLSLDTVDESGLTLTMISIKNSQFAVIEYLVNAGADLNMKNTTFDPAVDSFGYLKSLGFEASMEEVVLKILQKQEFDVSQLTQFLFSSIQAKNFFLADWVLEKGVNPNFVREKKRDTPLIFLFKQKSVEDIYEKDEKGQMVLKVPHFQNLKKIFYRLVDHPDIEINQKVRRDTALRKAKSRLKKNPLYQEMVDKLLSLGAK